VSTRRYSPEFKAKVALESLRGDVSQALACRRYGIAPDQLSRWRRRLIEGASKLFSDGNGLNLYLERIDQLERLVGKLALELEVSKKALSIWNSPERRKGNL